MDLIRNRVDGTVVGTVVQSGSVVLEHTALPASIPVSSWSALLAGVHRPVVAHEGQAEGEVPPYLLRPFDDEIDRRLRAGGFVALVGSSSSGKTRAAWEAVRRCLPEWTVRLPAVPSDLVALARSNLPPNTVIWLDDAVRVLDEQAAAAVREVLATRSDVVFIATMWHEHWIRSPERPHMSALLGASRRVDVPQEFTAVQCAAARASSDARLREAADSGGTRISQYLAAGPALVERHRDLSPYGRAVVDAMVHIGELLSGLPTIEVAVVRAASALYLDADAWNRQPPDWLDHAVVEAADLVRGAVSPLEPVRARSGELIGYRLADYLMSRLTPGVRPPALWDVLVEHVRDPQHRAELGYAAGRRQLLRHAASFYRVAAEADPANLDRGTAAVQFAHVLARRGSTAEAHEWLGRVLDAGWTSHADMVADAYRWLDPDAAFHQLGAAARKGSVLAKAVLALLLSEMGDHEEATAWALSLVGLYGDHWFLAADMAESGNVIGAVTLLEAHDESAELEHFALALARAGHVEQAERMWGPLLEAEDAAAMATYARWLFETGRVDESASWLQRVLTLDDRVDDLDELLGGLLLAHGLPEEAALFLAPGPLAGDVDAERTGEAEAEARVRIVTQGWGHLSLGELLSSSGRQTELDLIERFGLNPDGSTASPW